MRRDVDFSDALMKEGDWYLIAKEKQTRWQKMITKSMIAHDCPNERQRPTLMDDIYGSIHTWTGENGQAPFYNIGCGRCETEASKELLGLWTLHNWDYITNEIS